MRSWMYRHPTCAWLICLVLFMACAAITYRGLTTWDGWWKIAALGWALWTWELFGAIQRFWRIS